MTNEDCALAEQAVRGNTEAFSRLVGRYANAVYAAAYSRLGNAHDAEDAAQEVFVKAWYNLSKLQDPGKFGSWLMSIARNAAEDFARKSKPVTGLEEAVLIDGNANFTEETILRRERQRAVWKALGELDEKYRMVMIAVLHRRL